MGLKAFKASGSGSRGLGFGLPDLEVAQREILLRAPSS